MDKYFKPMGDLVDTGKKDFPKNDIEVGYFHPAGDLTPISTVQEMTDYFIPAGDLDGQGKNIILPKENTGYITPFKNPEEIVDYFRPAGDLDSEGKNIILPKENGEYITPFKNPEEIVDYFRPAGDLNKEINIKNISEENKLKMTKNIDEINDYLLTVVSGKKYPAVCELGVLMGGGRMIVSLKELMHLVETGHNIVSANVINADRDMIEVEVQRYVYDEELMEKRRRF